MTRTWKPRAWVAAAVAVCAAVLVVHGRCVTHDFVNWDDPLYVVENPAVVTPDQVPWWRHILTPTLGYPIPVTIATYQVERALFGLDPAPYHATNLALHALVALALMATLRRWGAGDAGGPWITGGVALAFALHPATVEPVAWVSGRKELLAALFSLLALATTPRPAAPPGAMRRADDPGSRSRWAPVAFVLLAFLSKPSSVLVPVLLGVLDGGHRRLWGIVTALGLGLAVLSVFLEHDVGAIGLDGGVTGVIVGVLASAAWHARILAFPFDVSPKYLNPPGGPEPVMLVSGALVIAAFLALAAAAWRRRHPAWPGLALALLAYLPSSGVVPLHREYSDSYVYLPLAGLALALGATLFRVLPSVRRGLRAPALVTGLLGLLAFGMTSVVCAGTWRDGVTLWTALHRRYPDSPQVCRNLGNAWMFGRNFRPERAAAVYRRCIETLDNRPFFVKNLAVATFHAGDLNAAESLFHEVLRDHPGDTVATKYLNDIVFRRQGSGHPIRGGEGGPGADPQEEPAWTKGP